MNNETLGQLVAQANANGKLSAYNNVLELIKQELDGHPTTWGNALASIASKVIKLAEQEIN